MLRHASRGALGFLPEHTISKMSVDGPTARNSWTNNIIRLMYSEAEMTSIRTHSFFADTGIAAGADARPEWTQ